MVRLAVAIVVFEGGLALDVRNCAPPVDSLAGFIRSKIVNSTDHGVLIDIVLNIVGAFVGGYLFTLVGAAPVTGLNLYSLLVAVVGAIVLLD